MKRIKKIRERFAKRIKALRDRITKARKKRGAAVKKAKKQEHHSHGTVAMFDSVTVSEIPTDAKAAAGYVNGIYTTWPQIKAGPWPHKLSIAVTASADAECLDCEPGDATPDQAPAWVKRQHGKGIKRPVVYTSLSGAQALLGVLAKAGIERKHVRLWTAHYTGKAHICDSSCGFGFTGKADATQWTDKALGRNLDESLCSPDFF
jgi:hypothetical protein